MEGAWGVCCGIMMGENGRLATEVRQVPHFSSQNAGHLTDFKWRVSLPGENRRLTKATQREGTEGRRDGGRGDGGARMGGTEVGEGGMGERARVCCV